AASAWLRAQGPQPTRDGAAPPEVVADRHAYGQPPHIPALGAAGVLLHRPTGLRLRVNGAALEAADALHERQRRLLLQSAPHVRLDAKGGRNLRTAQPATVAQRGAPPPRRARSGRGAPARSRTWP